MREITKKPVAHKKGYLFIYASLRAYEMVNIYVYLVLPLAGTFDMLMLTVMYQSLTMEPFQMISELGELNGIVGEGSP